MSRVDSFDGEYVPEGLWNQRLSATLYSKRGKERLREFASILDAMPEKKLIANTLEREGQVCFVGAICRAKGVEMPKPRYDDDCDIYDTAESGQRAGIPWTLAWTMGSLNDNQWGRLSPEERWLAARRWIDEQLAKGIA
jgi:hypothetical protein